MMSNTHTVNETLIPKKPFDLMRDFAPITGVNYSDLIMVIHPSVQAANLKEFDEPTLGVVVRDRFYFVANSQWGKFDDKHQLPPNDRLRRPLVLRLDLKDKQAPGRPADPQPERPSPLPKLPLPKLPGR